MAAQFTTDQARQDGVAFMLSKSIACLAASWALMDQAPWLSLGLLGVVAFFVGIALNGARGRR